MVAEVAEFQQTFPNSLSAEHMHSKTCTQKSDCTRYGMYAKYAKENHAEIYGKKWETFNEAKVIFHQWVQVFAADQQRSLLAVLFGLSDASLRRSSMREEYDTGVADDRRMGSSDGNLAGVIPEHTREFSSSGSVFF